MQAKEKALKMDKPTLGVCYYPEHWDESLWREDLTRMLAHGIEVARVFEFAWNMAEPTDGVFDFAFFDRFLNLAREVGMKIILCTPTATPPAWLTHAHPEVLNADMDGNKMHHGHRRHYNYNAQIYLFYTERIVRKLAERYGNHPAIIGWQIDNEINCEIDVFYADVDRVAFREYLKEHFGTLDALNEAIGARFWNQTYTDWAQVDLSRHTLDMKGNPHMELLEKRFFSKSAVRYVKLQSDILREYAGDRFITTNGMFGHVDAFEMTNTALDFITYDSYPNFAYGETGINAGDNGLKDRSTGMNLSYARAISPTFGVMEQQSGANGWDFRMLSPMPKPGQMRLWTMQSIAHGADFVSYFRWRTCAFGTEIYWHGLNDYSNEPNRRLAELKTIHDDVEKLGGLAGARYQAQVALVSDYLNEWDGERDRWHGPLAQLSRRNIFAAAQRTHTPMDMLWMRHTNTHTTTLKELSRYRVLVYPHATILTKETAELLEAYVRGGGTLLMGSRTGYKDEYGRCPMMPMPGHAGPLCGVKVEDYTFARAEEPVRISFAGQTYDAPVFHDVLSPVDGGECIATFVDGYYDGACALVRKRYDGGGAAYYLGSGFDEALVKALLTEISIATPYGDVLTCPEAVELACRVKDGTQYIFVLNYTGENQRIALHRPVREVFSEQEQNGEVMLPPYGVMVFCEAK